MVDGNGKTKDNPFAAGFRDYVGRHGAPEPRRMRARPVRLSDIRPTNVRWVWDRRIALGKLMLISGYAGDGKTMIQDFIAARLSTGDPWPDEPGRHRKPMGVLILTAEDDLGDTVLPRIEAAGGDSARVWSIPCLVPEDSEILVPEPSTNGDQGDYGHDTTSMTWTPDMVAVNLARHMEQIRDFCEEEEIGAILIDPIKSFLAGVDCTTDGAVRAAMMPLVEYIRAKKMVCIMISHLSKATGRPALHRVSDSIAFGALPRTAFVVAKDPEDAAGDRRLFVSMKSNLSEPAPGLAFHIERRVLDHLRDSEDDSPIETGLVIWDSAGTDTTAEDLLREALGESPEARRALDEATAWLWKALSDGPVLRGVILHDADGNGIAMPILNKAKARLRVSARRLNEEECADMGARPETKNGMKVMPFVWLLPEDMPEPGVVVRDLSYREAMEQTNDQQKEGPTEQASYQQKEDSLEDNNNGIIISSIDDEILQLSPSKSPFVDFGVGEHDSSIAPEDGPISELSTALGCFSITCTNPAWGVLPEGITFCLEHSRTPSGQMLRDGRPLTREELARKPVGDHFHLFRPPGG